MHHGQVGDGHIEFKRDRKTFLQLIYSEQSLNGKNLC